MAYSAVPTVITGDLWSAADHNTYIKDNFAATVPDIFTAAGDLVYGTGADAASVLAIGTYPDMLVVNLAGDAPEWGSFHSGCGLSRTTNQSVSASVISEINFESEIYDTDAYWSSDNDDAVVIPFDGLYMATGVITFKTPSTDATGDVLQRIYVGSTQVAGINALLSEDSVISFNYMARFSASNNPYLAVMQGGPGAVNVTAEYQVSWMGSIYMKPLAYIIAVMIIVISAIALLICTEYEIDDSHLDNFWMWGKE